MVKSSLIYIIAYICTLQKEKEIDTKTHYLSIIIKYLFLAFD